MAFCFKLKLQMKNASCVENVVMLCVFDNYKKLLLFSSCLSVRPASWNSSAPNDPMFTKFDIWAFFENMSKTLRMVPCTVPSALHTRPTQRALKTATHPNIQCRKLYAATQHLMLLMTGVCAPNM